MYQNIMTKSKKKSDNVVHSRIKQLQTYLERIRHSLDLTNVEILNIKPNEIRRSPIMIEFADSHLRSMDLQRTMEAGMNILKFKMAESTMDEKITTLERVKEAVSICYQKRLILECLLTTCATLKTWVIKTGVLEDPNKEEYINIEVNSEVVVTNNKAMMSKCNEKQIFIDCLNLGRELKVGMEIIIGEGEIVMKCVNIVDAKSIKCLVTKGGKLGHLQMVFIRKFQHTTPFITKADIQIIKFCSEHQESDGVLLQRDFLGFELDETKLHALPRIQKWIAGKCLQSGKPMYLAGGVLKQVLLYGNLYDSEVADVANAIIDGVTGFLLKDCYYIKNVLLAIEGLNDICCSMEPIAFRRSDFWRMMREPKLPVNAAEAAAMSCVAAANQTKARVIVIPTVTGKTACTLIRLRPVCLVITVSTSHRTARLLNACRNVVPLIYRPDGIKKSFYKEVNDRIEYARRFAYRNSWLQFEDRFVTLERSSENHPFCDLVRIWTTQYEKPEFQCNEDGTQAYTARDRKKHDKIDKENVPKNTIEVDTKNGEKKSLTDITAKSHENILSSIHVNEINDQGLKTSEEIETNHTKMLQENNV